MQLTPFLLSLAFLQVAGAIPAPDRDLQKLLHIPAGHPSGIFGQQPISGRQPPFSPGHRDPYDHKVDSVGDDRQPLPYRNGDGTTVMGPRNRDRERQNPDLVRPPSTDHGSLPNMRWSFADSHIRIEVWLLPLYVSFTISRDNYRKADGPDKLLSANCLPAVSWQG